MYLRKICLESYNEKQISIKPIKRVFIARKSDFRRYNESDLLEIAKNMNFRQFILKTLVSMNKFLLFKMPTIFLEQVGLLGQIYFCASTQ